MPKQFLVAIQYGGGDTIMNVIKVKSVDEQKYRELLNKKFIYDQKQIEEKTKLLDRITSLENQVKDLQNEIKVLKGE